MGDFAPRSERGIEVSNLTVTYPVRSAVLRRVTASVNAVSDVSLTVRPGETLGIVGESGCGKSTLLRTIMGLQSRDSGSVVVDGREIDGRSGPVTSMQMVFQSPDAALDPRMKVWESVSEPLIIAGERRRRVLKEEAAKALDQVGLPSDAGRRFPHAFSGGQKQRISLARALVSKPSALLLDEPTSALDVSIQAQIVDLIRTVQAARKLSVILVSHNLAVVSEIADSVAVMYLGTIVEQGPVERVYANPRHPYTRALLEAVPTPDPSADVVDIQQYIRGEPPSPLNPPDGCRFHTRCPEARPECSAVQPVLSSEGPIRWACHFPL